MPFIYVFKDSKHCDNVARALLFVAKFSKDQALVKFSESSMSIIWGGLAKTCYIHSEISCLDMFSNASKIRPLHHGIDCNTVIQINPTILGKTLGAGPKERSVTINIHSKSNKVQVLVEHDNSAKRTIVHTLPCEIKNILDYNNMLIKEVERSLCRYDTKFLVEHIHRFKHIIDSFARLNTPRIYIWSAESSQGNDLTIQTRTQGSSVTVSLSDLLDAPQDGDQEDEIEDRRSDAGVNIDTKKLALFLSGLSAPKGSKVRFDIQHNKCLKLTLDSVVPQAEESHQSILLMHSLNK